MFLAVVFLLLRASSSLETLLIVLSSSRGTIKEMIKDNKTLSIVLDFHIGVMMALDSAKQLGISTDLKVLDTRNLPSAVRSLLDDNDFSDYDAVIGPMREGR